jgi:alkylation response protein AidB-like acyl-CoA dehydrogenase
MNEDKIESPELREYRVKARAWLADHIPPLGRGDDGQVVAVGEEDDPAPERQAEARQLQAKLYEAGYAGFTFPVDYGGQGLTLDHEGVFLEEAAGYDLPIAEFGVSINILGATLAAFGTHEQKLAHIPNILSGKERWLQFLSEPSGGSDLAGLLTSATRDGDSFVVNGQKTWSTGAHLSNFALCPVRTRWDVPKHKGISVLIIDLKTPGIEIRRIKQINGGSEFCEEFFTDALVPASNLVGGENEGWRVARGLLEIEHAWVGRGGAGGSRSRQGVHSLVSLAKRRAIDGDQGVRRQVVGIHVAAQVQRLVAARVANGVAAGKLPAGYGSLMKLGNDILAQRRAELSLSLSGGDGVAWGPDDSGSAEWSNGFLSSRSASIAGGTDEIQRNNVSERVLGLPREPMFDRDVPFNQVPHN